ncbi:hypothetical protein AAGT00_29095 [Streptomyces cavourensis]
MEKQYLFPDDEHSSDTYDVGVAAVAEGVEKRSAPIAPVAEAIAKYFLLAIIA